MVQANAHWFSDEGTASVEYLILLVVLTIGLAFAIISLGPGVIALFEARALWLSLPLP